MARRGDSFVQGRLFDSAWTPSPAARKPSRRGSNRVTRDPAVAEAHAVAHRFDHSVKLGLASVLASRTPEERAAIRALFERPRVA